MSEEKVVQTKECNCFCKSEGFRNFIVIALGTFAGVYMALSLFSAIHKPQIPCHRFIPPVQMQSQFENRGDFHKFKKFHKEFKGDVNKVKAPEIDD